MGFGIEFIFDQDLSESTDYLIPKIIAYYYNKYLKNFDTPILEAGTGLVGNHLKDILPDAVYISSSDHDLTDIDELLSKHRHL